MKPWEKYQNSEKSKSVEIEAGPWTKYQKTEEIDPYAGLKQSAISSLPDIGEAIGSLVTKPTLVPSVAGAAAGRGLGTLAQKGIQYLQGQEQEPLEAAKEVGLQTAKGAAQGLLGAGIASGVGLLGKGVGAVYKKTASAATKLPEETLEYYAKNSKKIADVAEQIGKDPEQYADAIRAGFDKKIGTFMNDQNKIISAKLENAPNVKTAPVIDALEKAKAKIDEDAFPEAVSAIEKEISTFRRLGDEISANKMHAFKQRFQNMVNYMPTETFRSVQPQLNSAFEQAANVARKTVNTAVPEVAEANNNLSRLWSVKNNLNKNLIQEGKPSGALVQAGIGRNPRAVKNLERLSEITGYDFVTPTKEFGIGAQMSKAGLLGDIPTGYGLAPLVFGGAVGGPKGLLLGAAASPLGIKYIMPPAYKIGPGLLGAAQRGSKALVPAGSYLLENE